MVCISWKRFPLWAGLSSIFLLAPISSYISNKLQIIYRKLMAHKDKRIKIMNEILNSIKVLKLYAWESSFDDQVNQYRDQEIKRLRTRAFLEGPMIFAFNFIPSLVCWKGLKFKYKYSNVVFQVGITSFATYILMDSTNILTPQKAFVSLTLFNGLKDPLKFLPQIISWYTMVSHLIIIRTTLPLIPIDFSL